MKHTIVDNQHIIEMETWEQNNFYDPNDYGIQQPVGSNKPSKFFAPWFEQWLNNAIGSDNWEYHGDFQIKVKSDLEWIIIKAFWRTKKGY